MDMDMNMNMNIECSVKSRYKNGSEEDEGIKGLEGWRSNYVEES